MHHKNPQAFSINPVAYQDFSRSKVTTSPAGLTPQFLEVMSEVVAYISETVEGSIQAEGSPQPKGLVRRLLGNLRPGTPQAKGSTKRALLGPEQLCQARQLALARARQLNLSEEQARCLVDAVMGRSASDRDDSWLWS